MKYGILRVDMILTKGKPRFVKHWVLLPDTTARLFASLEDAQRFAASMLAEARLNGIGSGYRARAYNSKVIEG